VEGEKKSHGDAGEDEAHRLGWKGRLPKLGCTEWSQKMGVILPSDRCRGIPCRVQTPEVDNTSTTDLTDAGTRNWKKRSRRGVAVWAKSDSRTKLTVV